MKKYILSWPFLISATGVVLISLCGQWPVMNLSQDISILSALLLNRRADFIEHGAYTSAYYILMSMRDLDWFRILFPVLAAFTALYHFSREWNGSYFYMMLPRCGRSWYWRHVLSNAFLSGMLVILAGVLLYAGCLYAFFPTLGAFSDDAKEIVYELYGSTDAQRFGGFLTMALCMMLNGGMCAVLAVVLFAVIHDQFYTLSLLMIWEYLGMKLTGIYTLHLFEKYGFFEDPPVWEYIPYLLNPYNQLLMDHLFPYYFGHSWMFYILFLLAVLSVLAAVLYRLIRRRAQ